MMNALLGREAWVEKKKGRKEYTTGCGKDGCVWVRNGRHNKMKKEKKRE
jgi:hypothetical protein